MEVQFLGASREVTGSCFYINTGKVKFLVECGAFQGSEEIEKKNYDKFPFDPKEIDHVFLTHAHFDHIGRTPLLTKNGFKGKIYTTSPTKDLAEIVLMDSARLQQNEVLKEPLYSEAEVVDCMQHFETYPYSEIFKINDDLEFRFRDAGHILGSSIIEIWVKNTEGSLRKFVFSGDLGQRGQRIINDPEYVRDADYIFVEATYGNRLHKNKDETVLEFLSILKNAENENSNVLIPTFAIERTQEIIYELNLFYGKDLLKDFPVFLDSPMALAATQVFRKYQNFYDDDAKSLLKKGDDPFSFSEFKTIRSVDESKKLKEKRGCIIMAGSGMCTGGRILHHLINNIEDKNANIIFAGYQVRGTLGRKIVDGFKKVNIHGNELQVNAAVHTLGGFSAHGDERDLRYWLRNFGPNIRKVFVCHADEDVALAFSEKLNLELGLNTQVPHYKEIFALE